jgi:energy-converting hydrogenase Eha subunit H
VPSIFNGIVDGSARMVSSSPFYAYTYDNNFLRTAGKPILLIIIVLSIFLILKFIELLTKCS